VTGPASHSPLPLTFRLPIPFPFSPRIDANSAFFLGSVGLFITHIAALQLVERGLLTLDEPVSKYLVELRSLSVLSKKMKMEMEMEMECSFSRHRNRKSLSVTS
jgi:hypothetical protein